MLKKHAHKSITWIEVESPTKQEIAELVKTYNINYDIAVELEQPTYKEKIVLLKNYLYMVMHFPALRHTHKKNEQELDFIVGKNFIITTRYEPIDALEKFSQTFEVNKILDRDLMEDHAGYVLYYIIKELYKAISDELDSINDNLKLIEKNVFSGKERDMVVEISRTNRDLIHFARLFNSHEELLHKMTTDSEKLFGSKFSDNMDKILNEYYRLEKVLTANIDFLREIRSTNDSLLSSKQNEVMKLLTVITFLSLPFSVITDFVFQEDMFGSGIFAFLRQNSILVLLIEFSIFLTIYLIAKKNKWL
jgi:magnesium transporter